MFGDCNKAKESVYQKLSAIDKYNTSQKEDFESSFKRKDTSNGRKFGILWSFTAKFITYALPSSAYELGKNNYTLSWSLNPDIKIEVEADDVRMNSKRSRNHLKSFDNISFINKLLVHCK